MSTEISHMYYTIRTLNCINGRLVMLRSCRLGQLYLHVMSRREVTSSGDCVLRCQAPGLRGQNLKDIKRASISKQQTCPMSTVT